MITETRTEDGHWRYEGDGRIETIGTSENGRYIHQIHHCGWVETVKRLTDTDLAKLFEGEECLRVEGDSPNP